MKYKPGDLVKFAARSYWARLPDVQAYFINVYTNAYGQHLVAPLLGQVCEVLESNKSGMRVSFPTQGLTAMFGEDDFEPYNS